MDLPDKALSVRQPWAWAIIFAGKDIENRSWQAMNHGLNVRGRVAIHASKGMTQSEYIDAAGFMREIGVECPPPDMLHRGAVIGSVEVIDAVRESQSPWFFGPRGLVLHDPQFCEPRPSSGALGYFNWKSRIIDACAEPAKWMLPDQPKTEPQGSLI